MDVVREKNPKRSRLRFAAVHALGDMGPKAEKAVPLLIECVRQGATMKLDDPMNVCLGAMESLRRVGPAAKAALPVLKEIADDPEINSNVRGGAGRAAGIIERGPEIRPDPKCQ
jgi:HEAT repeat protein